MKKFTVIGLSSFGLNIARALSLKGNEVVAIDIDEKKTDELKDYNIQLIIADATKNEVLDTLNIEDSDSVIVSIGPNIEPSILVVYYLKKIGTENIIAKALSEGHSHILQLIGADRIIYPEKDEALRLSNILSSKNVIDYIPITEEYHLFEIYCPQKYFSKTIRELDVRKKFNILIIGLLDKYNENKFEMPDPDIILNENHTVLLLGTEKDVAKFS